MKKIVIVQDKVMHYRKAFLIELSKYYKVYVFHSEEVSDANNYGGNIEFVQLKKIKLGPFNYQRNLLKNIKKINPLATILTFDIRWLSSLKMALTSDISTKVIWWGLDIGKSRIALKVKLYLAKLDIPIVFYSRDNMRNFIDMGVRQDICFYANNTFDIGPRQKSYENINKNSFIFVGSFDKRKGIMRLLDLFLEVKPFLPKNMTFNLIGDGECFDEVNNFVSSNDLASTIILHGRVEDPTKLKKYYMSAFASISYSQAGLSVLQSLGFGVPFMALKGAISGGELSNIFCGFNGFLPKDDSEFKSYLISLSYSETSQKLGQNAYNYYEKSCTVENMVESFIKAIEFNE